MTDGHSGYDFIMPTGTPILAAAAGVVTRVTDVIPPFFCPPLNRNVDVAKSIEIEHLLPDGRRVRSWYVHFDRNDVAVGQLLRPVSRLDCRAIQDVARRRTCILKRFWSRRADL